MHGVLGVTLLLKHNIAPLARPLCRWHESCQCARPHLDTAGTTDTVCKTFEVLRQQGASVLPRNAHANTDSMVTAEAFLGSLSVRVQSIVTMRPAYVSSPIPLFCGVLIIFH